ncbi:GFA family protein [Aurantimonas sp. A2-1-M11]|uniref:GFA family protein n=1 Tax=Aurantimonas sp. A2-1-M11 TaxID=3113712 RepID=UPI002F94F2A1
MGTKRLQAKCLCGGVRIDANFEKVEVGVCHCETCRRWTAGPFMAIDGASNVVAAGTDLIETYQSSGWGERGFCRVCGTSLFWRSKDGEHYAMSAMLFDGLGDVRLTQEIFIDSKPSWYAFANETEKMTGAEFFAQFAPQQETPNG